MKKKGELHKHRLLISLSIFSLALVTLSACGQAETIVSRTGYVSPPDAVRSETTFWKGKSHDAGKNSVVPSAMVAAHNQWRLSRTGYVSPPDAMRSETTFREGESHDVEKNPVVPSAMVAAHNQWRSQVGVPRLKWSEKLVDVAQSWADTLKNRGCGFYHSGNGYGENLYKASPLIWSNGQRDFQDKTPKEVIDSWGSEIKYYNYANNSCSGVCGHYTQVVWKGTTEVGCAMSVCDDKSQIWACSYSPAGNIVGQKPY